MYTKKFGVLDESTGAGGGGKKKSGGVLEGIKLFVDHNFVKGIFFISCFFMIEVDTYSCTHTQNLQMPTRTLAYPITHTCRSQSLIIP